MKHIALVVSSMGLAASLLGQGQVNFNNRRPGSVVAPIYGVNPAALGTQMQGNANTNGGSVNYSGVPLLVGTGFSAALFAGQTTGDAGASMIALETLTFQSDPAAGFVQPSGIPVTVPGITGSGSAPWSFQVRAWDNRGGTINTWAGVLADGSVARGVSAPFTTSVSIAPMAAGYLVGMQSFNLTVIPEPSFMAVGALGLGLFLLLRKPKL